MDVVVYFIQSNIEFIEPIEFQLKQQQHHIHWLTINDEMNE